MKPHITIIMHTVSEIRSCVKVEADVLVCPRLPCPQIVRTVSVGVKPQH